MENQNNEKNKFTVQVIKNVAREVVSWAVTLVIAFTIAHLLTNYVIVNAKIPSESMENTIMTDDKLVANRLAYRNENPSRGDIVVFKYPVNEEQLYIKRIIGLPNETVEIIDGKIYIDGSAEPLEEDYLPEEWIIRNDGYTFEVPDGCYFMLGDNRNNSSDSRYWAEEAIKNGVANNEEEALKFQFVEKEKIVGKALFRYWPITDFKVF